MSDESNWRAKLVAQLGRISDPANPDLATLAHLRRSLGETEDRVLGKAGWLFTGVDDRDLSAAILMAGLFALTKGQCPHKSGVNFGAAFGSPRNEKGEPKHERRFVALLDTDEADLPTKLRQAVTLLASEGGIGFDWVMLVQNLQRWNDPDRVVQMWWARGFWDNIVRGGAAAAPAAAETAAT